jgi:hypothetical protein
MISSTKYDIILRAVKIYCHISNLKDVVDRHKFYLSTPKRFIGDFDMIVLLKKYKVRIQRYEQIRKANCSFTF